MWAIVKDKGPQGLCEDLRVAVLSCIIDTDPDSKKNKDILDSALLSDGNVFKFIGQYIQANPGSRPGSVQLSPRISTPPHTAATAVESLSTPYLQAILSQAQGSDTRSLADLANFLSVQLVKTGMRMEDAKSLAHDYIVTWQRASYSYDRLKKDVVGWAGDQDGLYHHLLSVLRGVPYDMYPESMRQYDLDGHLSSIVKKTLVYLNPNIASNATTTIARDQDSKSSDMMEEEQAAFIGPGIPAESNDVPTGANVQHQLPPRRYLMVTVSVDTVPLDGRLTVWQVGLICILIFFY